MWEPWPVEHVCNLACLFSVEHVECFCRLFSQWPVGLNIAFQLFNKPHRVFLSSFLAMASPGQGLDFDQAFQVAFDQAFATDVPPHLFDQAFEVALNQSLDPDPELHADPLSALGPRQQGDEEGEGDKEGEGDEEGDGDEEGEGGEETKLTESAEPGVEEQCDGGEESKLTESAESDSEKSRNWYLGPQPAGTLLVHWLPSFVLISSFVIVIASTCGLSFCRLSVRSDIAAPWLQSHCYCAP